MYGTVLYLCLQVTKQGQASYAHVHEIITGLRKCGWNVQLMEPTYRQSSDFTHLANKLWAFLVVQWKVIIRLRSVKVVYIRAHPAALPTVLACKILRKPVVLEVNGPYDEITLSHPWTRYLLWLFQVLFYIPIRFSDAVIGVASELSLVIQSMNHRKVVVTIPNGANTTLFSPSARTHRRLPPNFVVFFGALARWQGIETQLAAVESPKWPADVSLIIIGDGPEREKIVSSMARTSKIEYLGTLPYNEVPGVVARSLCGLSCQNNLLGRSNTGLSPLKVYETLACGVPVIVTDFPGQAELVRENNCGFVIPHDNSEALADAVDRLYRQPELRRTLGDNARATVQAYHSWEHRSRETSRLLIKVCQVDHA